MTSTYEYAGFTYDVTEGEDGVKMIPVRGQHHSAGRLRNVMNAIDCYLEDKERGFIGTVCKGCGEKIDDGDSRYSGREPDEYWHYRCWKKQDPRTFKELEKSIDEGLSKLKSILEGN